jgi:hypothetical protein
MFCGGSFGLVIFSLVYTCCFSLKATHSIRHLGTCDGRIPRTDGRFDLGFGGSYGQGGVCTAHQRW